jgi:2-oxoglutarate dehydrogenase E1 component
LKTINMSVVMPSNAANYFQLLRTHMRLPFRKPMVVIAPKKLLRFKGATSDITHFGEDHKFESLFKDKHDKLVAGDKVRKVVICSGQVYYDLEAKRDAENHNDVAIMRCESLCPFPFKEIIKNLKKYPNAQICWAQEEPKNAGAWTYAQPRLRNINKFMNRKDVSVQYAGRPMMAASAVGYTSTHNESLAALLKDAFK